MLTESAPHQQIQQIVIAQLQQGIERVQLIFIQLLKLRCQKLRQQQIVFKETAPRLPADALQAAIIMRAHNLTHPFTKNYMPRLTIISLILPMARDGFSPFGHTSTQFMMVWQRNKRYGSSRLSKRSLVA
jgi:hypothetical protein